jgi:acetamidase/formamidase
VRSEPSDDTNHPARCATEDRPLWRRHRRAAQAVLRQHGCGNHHRHAGAFSSNPPDIHAGNLDNKELIAGTALYIPVHAKGALFEVGDGHAAQGDGEVDQTAIETSLRGKLQSPCART